MGGKPRVKVTHEYEAGGGAYFATAPDGYRFRIGCHQLVQEYDSAIPGDRREAAAAARHDAKEHAIEQCTDTSCDWCES
jgi:hypothetical protein